MEEDKPKKKRKKHKQDSPVCTWLISLSHSMSITCPYAISEQTPGVPSLHRSVINARAREETEKPPAPGAPDAPNRSYHGVVRF